VGEQPKLSPGEIFEYTSFCPLPTPLGTMEGSFQMVEENGRQYDAIINPFMLVASQVLN
jgi:ApaG protein